MFRTIRKFLAKPAPETIKTALCLLKLDYRFLVRLDSKPASCFVIRNKIYRISGDLPGGGLSPARCGNSDRPVIPPSEPTAHKEAAAAAVSAGRATREPYSSQAAIGGVRRVTAVAAL